MHTPTTTPSGHGKSEIPARFETVQGYAADENTGTPFNDRQLR